MLASFIASNYAFYAANQGYTQGIVFPSYVNPSQFAGYSSVMTKNSALSQMTSKKDEETRTHETVGNLRKSETDSSDVKFSIARILGDTLPTEPKDVEEEQNDVMNEPTSDGTEESLQYSWLQCTRYKPPKLQRKKFYLLIGLEMK